MIWLFHNLFTNHIIYEPAFLCFIDLTQAFDRIKQSDVIKTLEKKPVSFGIINIIKDLNTNNNKTRLMIYQSLTEEISVNSGIRQGDSRSPIPIQYHNG